MATNVHSLVIYGEFLPPSYFEHRRANVSRLDRDTLKLPTHQNL